MTAGTTISDHLEELAREGLLDIHRHWFRERTSAPSDEESLRQELAERMADPEHFARQLADLSKEARVLLDWIVRQPGRRIEERRLEEVIEDDLPFPPYRIEALLNLLRTRGFVFEEEDRDWVNFGQRIHLVPEDLARELLTLEAEGPSTLAEELSLEAWIASLTSGERRARLEAAGVSPNNLDPRAVVAQLARPERVREAVGGIDDSELRELIERILMRHGGVGERRHLERAGLMSAVGESWPSELHRSLLGTVLTFDLHDTGIALGPGSILVYPELTTPLLEGALPRSVENEPDTPADCLEELGQLRTFIDHHTVRVKRDGSLYRTTARKVATEILGPGARALDDDEALALHLRFVTKTELARTDSSGRLRTTEAWNAFDEADPVTKSQQILGFVQTDLEGVRGALHMRRLRRLLLEILEEHFDRGWIDLRAAALLARTRYLHGLDPEALAEKFQRRYKYAPIPELTSPAVLARELERFAAGPLAWTGTAEVAFEDEDPIAIRLTRLGARTLGLEAERDSDPAPQSPGALIVTPDFEVVVFPDIGGVTLVHEIGRFARRRKADYSLHFTIERDSIHQAAARGLTAKDIIALLDRESRHPLPGNVVTQIRAWMDEVRLLAVSRPFLLKADAPEVLDEVLTIPEVKSAAGERLSPNTLELHEDPSTPRMAAALRSHRFFLK